MHSAISSQGTNSVGGGIERSYPNVGMKERRKALQIQAEWGRRASQNWSIHLPDVEVVVLFSCGSMREPIHRETGVDWRIKSKQIKLIEKHLWQRAEGANKGVVWCFYLLYSAYLRTLVCEIIMSWHCRWGLSLKHLTRDFKTKACHDYKCTRVNIDSIQLMIYVNGRHSGQDSGWDIMKLKTNYGSTMFCYLWQKHWWEDWCGVCTTLTIVEDWPIQFKWIRRRTQRQILQ